MQKYAEMVTAARENSACFFWQKVFKSMIADAYKNDAEIAALFEESLPSIKTKDQEKSMLSLAADLIEDKALLKTVKQQIKAA